MLGNTSPQELWWPRRGCLTRWDCYLYSPDGLIQRMEEFKAEAILFGGSLDQLTRMEQDCPNPLSDLWRLINKQHSWFQDTPQFGPALQSPTNLEERGREQKVASMLLLRRNPAFIQYLYSISSMFIPRLHHDTFPKENTWCSLNSLRDLTAKSQNLEIWLSEFSLHIFITGLVFFLFLLLAQC